MRVVLLGFGAVGRAFANLLSAPREQTPAIGDVPVELVGVVDSGGAAVSPHGLDPRALLAAKAAYGTVASAGRLGDRSKTVAHALQAVDIEADVLVDATPSALRDPAEAIARIETALAGGKHVVTVNKAPLAWAFPRLMGLALQHGKQLRYSGTVGAGTPVLALARECAHGDEVRYVRAVLNGTTNFVLSRMHAGAAFDDALAEAQRLGYAEADPAADVDGWDTAAKLVILANAVLGRAVTLDDVDITGIRGVTPAQIREAEQRDEVVRLVGEIADRLTVSPQTVPVHDPLDVPASRNAVTLTLRHAGEVTLVGNGAGGTETATAILRDLALLDRR